VACFSVTYRYLSGESEKNTTNSIRLGADSSEIETQFVLTTFVQVLPPQKLICFTVSGLCHFFRT